MSLSTKIKLMVCALVLALVAASKGANATNQQAEYLENGLVFWQEPLTSIVFVWVDGGCFMMGQDDTEKAELSREAGEGKYREFYSDETPRHEVCVDGFWLGRYEVTQGQWLSLMDEHQFPAGRTSSHPAEKISWDMAKRFIEILNAKSDGVSFRLPFEAEWEYGARAGTFTPFNTGRTISTDQANYNGSFTYGRGSQGSYRATPLPVGSLPANAWGLFDMHGNLWEWCEDFYHQNYYELSPRHNPTGPVEGAVKVMRGGSWFTSPRSVRSANRRGVSPGSTVDDAGFRLVCKRPPPDKIDLMLNSDF